MRLHHLLLAVAATLACTLLASALEFQPIGYEAIGMGGAGVASAKGSMAGYYNPALLARSRHTTEVNLAFGLGLKEYNLLANAQQLSDLDLTNTVDHMANAIDFTTGQVSNSITPTDRKNIKEIQAVWKSIGTNNGIDVSPAVALGVQVLNVGVGIFTTGNATMVMHLNPNQNQLVFSNDQTIAGTTYKIYLKYDPDTNTYSYNALNGAASVNLGTALGANNIPFAGTITYDPSLTEAYYTANAIEAASDSSSIDIRGLVLNEIPVSYARNIAIPKAFGALAVGGSLKLMNGITYSGTLDVDTDESDLQDALTKNSKTSMTFGADLGLLYNPPVVRNLTVGLVYKNLNTPKFDYADGTAVEVKPQMRAGLDYALWKDRLNFAADLDLTKNTGIDARESQYVCAGANFHPFSWFSLRAGVMNNMADTTLGTIGTVGLGFGLKWFQLDLAGQSSFKTTTISESKVPSYAKLNLALVSKW
jgi:hypothetical protein